MKVKIGNDTHATLYYHTGDAVLWIASVMKHLTMANIVTAVGPTVFHYWNFTQLCNGTES